jgi:5-formyltetrahydrofolate cyclo-ligase
MELRISGCHHMSIKEKVRRKLQQEDFPEISAGKVAEQFRRENWYGNAQCIFVTPDIFLKQIRVNSLLDGKSLVMPSAGLREGFFMIKPHAVPFTSLNQAVTENGLRKFGQVLQLGKDRIQVDAMITGALAVDQSGARIGSGKGYFDLSCALFSESEAFTHAPRILAVIHSSQLRDSQLPIDPWDVKMAGVVTKDGCQYFSEYAWKKPQILWQHLSTGRIKKINPLWQLHRRTL